MPSVHKTKSTWSDKEWKLEAYYLCIPIQKQLTTKKSLHTITIFNHISRTPGGPATKILSTIDYESKIIH